KRVRALCFGERTLAACWSPHSPATDFPECETISDKGQKEEVRDRRMRSPALRMSALPKALSVRVIIIFSCRRPRLRTPRRQRRRCGACLRLLQRRRRVGLEARVGDLAADPPALTPACKARR